MFNAQPLHSAAPASLADERHRAIVEANRKQIAELKAARLHKYRQQKESELLTVPPRVRLQCLAVAAHQHYQQRLHEYHAAAVAAETAAREGGARPSRNLEMLTSHIARHRAASRRSYTNIVKDIKGKCSHIESLHKQGALKDRDLLDFTAAGIAGFSSMLPWSDTVTRSRLPLEVGSSSSSSQRHAGAKSEDDTSDFPSCPFLEASILRSQPTVLHGLLPMREKERDAMALRAHRLAEALKKNSGTNLRREEDDKTEQPAPASSTFSVHVDVEAPSTEQQAMAGKRRNSTSPTPSRLRRAVDQPRRMDRSA